MVVGLARRARLLPAGPRHDEKPASGPGHGCGLLPGMGVGEELFLRAADLYRASGSDRATPGTSSRNGTGRPTLRRGQCSPADVGPGLIAHGVVRLPGSGTGLEPPLPHLPGRKRVARRERVRHPALAPVALPRDHPRVVVQPAPTAYQSGAA